MESTITKRRVLYENGMLVLAVISVGMAIYDLVKGLPAVWVIADNVIYCIFLADYFVRLVLAKGKKEFVKHNIPDLIAIIPFSSAFRIFRTAKLLRLSKVSRISKLTKMGKLAKIGGVSARGARKARRFLDTNGFKYILLITAGAVLIGALAIMLAENMSFTDAIWWAFVTATTVGYGDISPATGTGRIIAALLMLVGIGLVGSLTSTITSYFLDQRAKEKPVISEKVEMVMMIYNSLNDEEKETIRKQLTRE